MPKVGVGSGRPRTKVPQLHQYWELEAHLWTVEISHPYHLSITLHLQNKKWKLKKIFLDPKQTVIYLLYLINNQPGRTWFTPTSSTKYSVAFVSQQYGFEKHGSTQSKESTNEQEKKKGPRFVPAARPELLFSLKQIAFWQAR